MIFMIIFETIRGRLEKFEIDISMTNKTMFHIYFTLVKDYISERYYTYIYIYYYSKN